MELIIGGIYQGKTRYVIEKLGIEPDRIYNCAKIQEHARQSAEPMNSAKIQKPGHQSAEQPDCAIIQDDIERHIQKASCIDHLELYLWNCAMTDRQPISPSSLRPDAVLICEDIFCGIVPIDKMERKWRQMAGRYLQKLTSAGARVTRVVCGVGMGEEAHSADAMNVSTDQSVRDFIVPNQLSRDGAAANKIVEMHDAAAHKKVLLIRHGATEMNEEHRYCGRSDPPLSAAGREALENLRGKYGTAPAIMYSELRESMQNTERPGIIHSSRHSFHDRAAFYTSGMRRAEQTMEILFGDIAILSREKVHIEADLREMDFGIFEGKSYEMLRDTAEYQAWITGDNRTNVCPGGESGAQMEERVCKAFERIVHTETADEIVIVSHGGPIAAILMHLMPRLSANRYRWQPEHGGSWLLDIEVGKEALTCRSCVPFV